MPTTPENLIATATPPIKDATRIYLSTRNAAKFEATMQKALATHHTAAYIKGTAERLGVSVGTIQGLSRAERADIKKVLEGQFGFLKAFVGEVDSLSDAAVAARAALYAGATRATYWGAKTNNALPVYPGGCPQCYTNCRCDLMQEDDGWHWNATNDKATCDGCRERGAAWQPYRP